MVWTHPQNGVKGNFSPELLDQIKRKINDRAELTLQVNRHLYRIVDCSGNSLLHYAAEFGNEYITKFLLDSRAKVNIQNHDGNTPLLLATKGQHAATIKVLLENDCDILVCNNNGISAVQMALRISPIDFKIAKLFLQRISYDCSEDNTKIIEILMKIGCPIYVAVLLENVNVTTGMLSEGCSIEAKDPKSKKTALHIAVENVNLQHVEKLLFLGAKVKVKDASGKPPLALLSDFRKPDDALSIINILLSTTNLASCDNDGFMYMRSILRNGTYDAVFTVLASLDRMNVTDSHGQNIIHYLAANYQPGIVEIVKRFKCHKSIDLNARDEFGLTALHHAVNVGNASFVEYLVSQGVNLHILSKDGVSPLMQAVQPMTQSRIEQRAECVKILLMNKAHPDIFMGNYFKKHHSESAIERDYPLIGPAVAILAIWKAIERPFNQGILKKINLMYPRLKRLFDACTNELENMKNITACWNMTVLDILAEYDDNQCSRYSIFFAFSGRWTQRVIRRHQSIPIYYEFLDKRVRKVISMKKDSIHNFIKRFFIILGIFIGFIIGFILFILFVITGEMRHRHHHDY